MDWAKLWHNRRLTHPKLMQREPFEKMKSDIMNSKVSAGQLRPEEKLEVKSEVEWQGSHSNEVGDENEDFLGEIHYFLNFIDVHVVASCHSTPTSFQLPKRSNDQEYIHHVYMMIIITTTMMMIYLFSI